MHVPPNRSSSGRQQRLLAALAASAASLWISACASPGLPKPPSLHLPDVVPDLSAQRVGDGVHLRWTSPSRTTDGSSLPTALRAQVCREINPQPAKSNPRTPRSAGLTTAPGCDTVLNLTVKPGLTEADDRLPVALTTDPVRLIGYRVRLLNHEGRSAGYSHIALAPAGEAPAHVTGLQAKATRDGAMVEWQRAGSASLVELDRTLLSAVQVKSASKKSGFSLAENQPDEVRLRTAKDDVPTADPGGTLDHTALRGQKYQYRAQRIRAVEVAGKKMEMRSTDSAPVVLAMTDKFPPSAPSGLATIPGGEVGHLAVDLSWQVNIENDLAGYNVYRRPGTGGDFKRLTDKPVAGPAFSDTAVAAGNSYTYRVTAVDADGNESMPSSEATEMVQQQ